jgi:hypothetical protein
MRVFGAGQNNLAVSMSGAICTPSVRFGMFGMWALGARHQSRRGVLDAVETGARCVTGAAVGAETSVGLGATGFEHPEIEMAPTSVSIARAVARMTLATSI